MGLEPPLNGWPWKKTILVVSLAQSQWHGSHNNLDCHVKSLLLPRCEKNQCHPMALDTHPTRFFIASGQTEAIKSSIDIPYRYIFYRYPIDFLQIFDRFPIDIPFSLHPLGFSHHPRPLPSWAKTPRRHSTSWRRWTAPRTKAMSGVFFFSHYPLVNIQKAIEHGHLVCGFTHQKWSFSIVVLVYQRVSFTSFFLSSFGFWTYFILMMSKWWKEWIPFWMVGSIFVSARFFCLPK